MSRKRRRITFLTVGAAVLGTVGVIVAVDSRGSVDTALECAGDVTPPSAIGSAEDTNVPCAAKATTTSSSSSTTTTVQGSLNYDPAAWVSEGEPLPDASTLPFGEGAFRTACHAGHVNFSDPIIYPGVAAPTHLHQFFGNLLTDGNSTYDSLLADGQSTCDGGPINRSGYWMPAMINTATDKIVRPSTIIVYYKEEPTHDPQPLPLGLRMVAGYNMTTMSNDGHVSWICESTSATESTRFPECASGNLVGSVDFPSCWDGANLDSADHRSHMAYPPEGGACTDPTHPVKIPRISYKAYYDIAGENIADWKLASDVGNTEDWGHQATMATMDGGTSLHGDWFGAWNEEYSDRWYTHCNLGFRNCNPSQLGDGGNLQEGTASPIAARENIPVRPVGDWLWKGDSISVISIGNGNALEELITAEDPGRTPNITSIAVGGTGTSTELDNIASDLDAFDGKYVVLAYGTNDSPEVFAMEELVQAVIAAGKVPVVPLIPWNQQTAQASDDVQDMNAEIEDLYDEYPEVIPGPDLYAAFEGRTDLLQGSTNVHPNDDGSALIRQLWAETIADVR